MSMSEAAVAALADLERRTGGPLKITSAHRSPEHNAAVGGAKNSQHIEGNAYDFDVSGMPYPERVNLARLWREIVGGGGVGFYDNALHLDVGPERAWGHDYTKDTIPDWATGFGAAGNALNAPVGTPQAPNSPEPQNRLAQFYAAKALLPKYDMQQDVRNFLT